MIPYYQFPSLHLVGPFALHVFGALVAIGILLGAKMTMRRGEALGLPREDVSNAIFWTVLVGFLFAHVFDVFAYQDGSLGEKLARVWNPFDGISSIGGFVGALVALTVYVRRRKQSLLAYADSFGFGLAPGWLFGRMGCFSAHDHPGRFTHFFLGVKYPGGTRHDLGLYEAIFSLLLTALFFLLARRKRAAGLYIGLFALLYGPTRFFLDFLRATDVEGADPRYFHLTPAQWACIAVTAVGAALCVHVLRHGAAGAGKDGSADSSAAGRRGSRGAAPSEA